MKSFVVLVLLVAVAAAYELPKFHITTLKDLDGLGSRIISGQPAAVGQFPWQVVNMFTRGSGTAFCGGALICDRWVLTAAHCAFGASSFTIYLGSVNQSQAVETGRVVIQSTQAIVHEDYNSSTLNNDIALIRLPQKVNYTDSIQPITLGTNYIAENLTLTVSGWGKTSDGPGGVSPILNWVNLRTITNRECEGVYGSPVVKKETICCRGNPQHSTCNGDSGGPLVQQQSNGTYVHVGVVSFVSSAGCASGDPSGYVRTASYLDWIKRNINGTCVLPSSSSSSAIFLSTAGHKLLLISSIHVCLALFVANARHYFLHII